MSAIPDDDLALYEILRNHDVRFDGQVYVGVSSTGIYCRPVCRARRPKRENCTFFTHAAVAEKAGFRPCLLCRPELAPGNTKVDALSRLAHLAVRRIEDGALNDMSVAALAAEFGVSDRHLRRAMNNELGVTPIELAQTQRLLQAKQLLTESDLSVTEIAFAAGFESLRRFNALFKSRYRMAPSALRRDYRQASGAHQQDTIRLTQYRIDYRPPFYFDGLLGFLSGRAIPGVERVTASGYQRTVRIGEHAGWLSVQRHEGHGRKGHALSLQISDGLRPAIIPVLARIKAVFDTRADIVAIEQALSRDPMLEAMVSARSGLRVPGAFDGFELLVRAILGQQVSVKGATTLSGRLAGQFGEKIDDAPDDLSVITPSAERLAGATVAQIAAIGLPRKRAETIHLAAKAVSAGDVTLSPGADPERVSEQLQSIPGIGEWTSAYVAMRALAWPDAIPLGDLGIRKALGLNKAKAIANRAETWAPWRAYAAMHLWASLAQAG